MGVGRSGMGLYHWVGIWSWGKKIFLTDMVFLRTVELADRHGGELPGSRPGPGWLTKKTTGVQSSGFLRFPNCAWLHPPPGPVTVSSARA
jgi:hypothetical protein